MSLNNGVTIPGSLPDAQVPSRVAQSRSVGSLVHTRPEVNLLLQAFCAGRAAGGLGSGLGWPAIGRAVRARQPHRQRRGRTPRGGQPWESAPERAVAARHARPDQLPGHSGGRVLDGPEDQGTNDSDVAPSHRAHAVPRRGASVHCSRSWSRVSGPRRHLVDAPLVPRRALER